MSQDHSGHQTQESGILISGGDMRSFKGIKCSHKKQTAETDDNTRASWDGTRQGMAKWRPVEAGKEANPRPQMSFNQMEN